MYTRTKFTRKRRTHSRKNAKKWKGGMSMFTHMKIFIVHYKKLVDRKKDIIDQLAKYNLNNYEFVEIDRDELDKHNTIIFNKKMSNPLKAIALSHFHCYREIANKYECALILEDDAIFEENFLKKLSVYLKQLPSDYDMVFIGGCAKLHIEAHNIVNGKHIYEKGHEATSWGGQGASRCTHGYIVNKKCAVKIVDYINKLKVTIDHQIDFWLNTAIKENAFKIYWAEPTLISQGTQIGKMNTSYNTKYEEQYQLLYPPVKKLNGGQHKESILIILLSNEMSPEFKPQITKLKEYVDHLSKRYNVDIAAISSNNDFNNYSDILKFKYTYINTKRQLSKICDFITEKKSILHYDWYVKIRPEIEILDYNMINFKTLPKDSVSARAREYRGPYKSKYSCSVGGEGSYKHIKECYYKNTTELIVLDDNLYVFHKNVIDRGGFTPVEDSNGQNEWLHSTLWTNRNIKLNPIGINMKFSRLKNNNIIYSGNITIL